jgi:phospholipase/carboxylesterase
MIPLLSVEQFWRSSQIGMGQSRVWHFAAFFAGLPSKGQEIDDKLPYNSR